MKCNFSSQIPISLITKKKKESQATLNFSNPYFQKTNILAQPNYNDHLSKISFGRALKNEKDSHIGYLGANYLGNGSATFRVYAPIAQKMELQIAEKQHDFKYWEDLSEEDCNKIHCSSIIMNKSEKGIWETSLDKGVKPGQIYRYKLTDKDGNIKFLKDPRSASQPGDATGWSGIYDNNAYKWSDKDWVAGKVPQRIKHQGAIEDYGAPSGMVIEEVHIGLLGGFKKAKKEIDKVAEEGLCNTIYMLPIGEFFGKYNWGYDEVDKYAPESSYGSPDELKELVDYAHEKKINVILDVVPNHFGPIGTVVHEFGEAFDLSKETGWAVGLNFSNKDKEYMRHYMVDMMMNWLVNFHFDGLRVDATEHLRSDSTLKLMASEIRNHPETRNAILIPEHIDRITNLAQPLSDKEISDPQRTENEADSDVSKQKKLGYDVQYIYDFKNTLQALILDWDIYDCSPCLSDLADEFKKGNRYYNGQTEDLRKLDGNNSLVYFSSHDEQNAFGGARPIVRSLASELGLISQKSITSPDGVDKKPFQRATELLKDYIAGNIDLMESKGVSKQEFEQAYNRAKAKVRLAMGTTFVHPGQKLLFMGEQRGELAPFKFFAEYENASIESKVASAKGYDVGKAAFEDSYMDQKTYSDTTLKQQSALYNGDLAKLLKETPALSQSSYQNLDTHVYDDKIMQVHRWDLYGSDVIAVMNFGDNGQKHFDLENFPEGNWVEVLNSNDKKYGGDGQNMNTNRTVKRSDAAIEIPANSIVILKRVS